MSFEERLVPYRPIDLRGERVLVFAPHPDDETLGCGGSLALHSGHGDPVRVVFVTSGERGDWSGGRTDPGEIAMLREAEAGRALAYLGIGAWEFWRYPDRGIEVDGEIVDRIARSLAEHRPSLVYAPTPVDLHPDHRAVTGALRVALRGWPPPLRVALYEVGYASPVNALVDVTAAWEPKAAALGAYPSQLAGPHDLTVTEGLARFRSLTLGSDVRVAEGFRVIPVEGFDADPIWRWQALQESWTRNADVPAVSVIVRTRDRPSFLSDALASLEAQTFRDFEVVIVNDDGRPIAIEELRASHPGLDLRVVELRPRKGRGEAANAGVRAARGTFVAYLDDDDVYYPTHLETLHRFLVEHDHFGGAYTDAHVGRYRLDAETLRLELVERRVEHAQDFDRELLLFQNYVPNLCLMHRREGWERVGGFDAELEVLEDWDFVLRLAGEVELSRIPRCTGEYRIRNDGTNLSTAKPWGGPEELRARAAIYRRHAEKHTPETVLRVHEKLLRELFERRAADGRQAELGERADGARRRELALEARLGKLEERSRLLEHESEALAAELVLAGRWAQERGERIEELRGALDAAHGEIARREELIAAIRGTRFWRLRVRLRRWLGIST